ncbi:MAG: transposase [Gammaproteobacteria bacterium]|nr:transposase [Gammaproteobacteria bacterium]
MAATNPTLFDWNDVDILPDMLRLELVLHYLPDDDIVKALELNRGRGRDDYPIAAMWNAVIAGIVFQHRSIQGLVREMRRNPSLLGVCGFNPMSTQGKPVTTIVWNEQADKAEIVSIPKELFDTVPNCWNFYRFLGNLIELEENQGLIQKMMKTLREQLMVELPDFGNHLGYDGKAIDSHSTGQENRETGETSDPDANWGKHETLGIDSNTGKEWKKVKSWFGYGLHLIADTQYEIPVAFGLTPASHAEVTELDRMLDDLFEETPALAERCKDFSADRGLDSGKLKSKLWDEYQIRPLIDTRELWSEEKQMPDYDPSKSITRPLNPDRADNIIHTEKGEVFCVCPLTGEHRDLAFQGFEADRNTMKYRCPAAAYGLDCEGRESCYKNADINVGDFGRIIRIDITEQDRRIFTPTPFGSPSWHRGYNRRSALERINNRIDNNFGFEDHFIRGKANMTTRVGLALVVMMALALGHAKEGRQGQMRSLVKPIPALDTG